MQPATLSSGKSFALGVVLAVGVLVGAEVRAATGGSLSDWPVLRSYTGEHLRRIKMPLGGIGTGTISLSGTGGRNHGFARWRECTFKVAYPLARAEQVVRDIRSRYDGRKRNPFDEAECGHHYARALAAWTVLEAFQVKQED